MKCLCGAITAVSFCLQSVAAQQARQPAIHTGSLKAGFRAINVTLDADRAYYLSPDDLVDVIVAFDAGGGSQVPSDGCMVGTILKKKRVLAVKPSETDPGKSVVNVEVNPNEGQYIENSSHLGSIWLSLRKKGDIEDAPMELSTWGKILGPDFKPLRLACSAMSAGEPVIANGSGVPAGRGVTGVSLPASVEGRMREAYPALSFSVASDKVTFVQPGDRIDVLATIDAKNPKDMKKRRITLVLLQNILVLDIRKSEIHPGRNILFLALNFKEVQESILAWSTAEIQVMLRGKSDTETYPIQPASIERIFRP